MLAAHRKMRARPRLPPKNGNGSGPRRQRPAIFTALRGGMQQLVDALTARLDPTVRAPAHAGQRD